MNFNQNGSSILLTDSIQSKKDNRYLFSIKNHERKARINSEIINIQENYVNRYLFKKGSFISFNGKMLYLLSGNIKLYPSSEKITIDYLYLTRNPRLKPEIVFQIFDCDVVVIDENNWVSIENEWVEFCEQHGIQCYVMRKKGAFVLDIQAHR
jgi:hypothetical protein